MKKKTINVLAAITLCTAILGSGCLKNNENDVTPVPKPTGKFEGTFKMIRKKTTGNGLDTVINSTIALTLKADSNFKVTGDTTKHAGSYGNYPTLNYYYIDFKDNTYKETDTKKHLNGTYVYYYDGYKLQMARTYADTLSYQYDLRKTAN